jgi:hypothetical protein
MSDCGLTLMSKNKPVFELLLCPLCGGQARDTGHGISCSGCGLWLGDGTAVSKMGGYLKVWNSRPTACEKIKKGE